MVVSLHDRCNLSDIRWISDGFEPWVDFNDGWSGAMGQHCYRWKRAATMGRLRAFNARHSRTLGVSQNPSIFGLKSLLQIS
jgi:hypothetical protein